MATLDEIQRLVPGYDVSRMELMAGNDQHTSIEQMGPGANQSAEQIVPATTICSLRERSAVIRNR